MQDYHRVQAWRKAHPLALDVRRAVHRLPRGYADLKSQLVRAADSSPSNIVEGRGASTRKELARFLEIAIKSAMELEYRCELAAESANGRRDEWLTLAARTVEVRKITIGYRKAVLAADRREEAERSRRHPPAAGGESPLERLDPTGASREGMEREPRGPWSNSRLAPSHATTHTSPTHD